MSLVHKKSTDFLFPSPSFIEPCPNFNSSIQCTAWQPPVIKGSEMRKFMNPIYINLLNSLTQGIELQ